MTAAALDFRTLDPFMGGRPMVDVHCPWCGPARREHRNQIRKVLRLWASAGFISYHCARCGESGYVRDNERRRPVNREALQRARVTIDKREQIEIERRRAKALSLWRMRRPIAGTVAEVYLRQARGIACPLPPTLGFLPARDEYPPAMIAAFGMATEPEPGVLAIADGAVRGVHLTKLRGDGSGKADTEPTKLMVGRSLGSPIVLAPMSDALGLAIAEGIEDALSVHAATGLGTWAAGGRTRLPALADALPAYCDCVTVVADSDKDGQRDAANLLDRLHARGIHAELVPSDGTRS